MSLDDDAGLAAAAPIELRSLDDTARIFSVTTPTVRSWIADGCPVFERGSNGVAYKLDVRAVAAWRKDRAEFEERQRQDQAARDEQLRLELLGGKSVAGGDGAMTPAERAAAFKEEFERTRLAIQRGEYVEVVDMRMRLADMLAIFRDELRSVPDSLGSDLGLGDDVTAKMVERLDEILGDLADRVEAVFADRPGRADDAAA